jgi:cobalt-zinc-cadmium efflux system membrane fusion protein
MSVWVTTDRKRFEKRTVKIGLQQDGTTQILEGLEPGELVVTEGAVFVSNKALGASGASD